MVIRSPADAFDDGASRKAVAVDIGSCGLCLMLGRLHQRRLTLRLLDGCFQRHERQRRGEIPGGSVQPFRRQARQFGKIGTGIGQLGLGADALCFTRVAAGLRLAHVSDARAPGIETRLRAAALLFRRIDLRLIGA